MHPAAIVLVVSVLFVAYAYGGYPFCLWLLSRLRRRKVRKGDAEPPVSLVIAVHNEGARIREKLENALALDYPRERLEIIVASDCSTDRTDEIVTGYTDRGIRWVRSPVRAGKEAAQKRALDVARGEIIAFSDAATILPPNAIRNIVRSFADSSVGCVSSVDRVLTERGEPGGEGMYVRYEMLLRQLETQVGTVVGLSGSFFAARRDVCDPWRPGRQSDFSILINAVRSGRRGVSDPDSVGLYRSIADPSREYERKVRTVLRGITVFLDNLSLVNPLRYRLFAWQIVSHKLCRWLVPFALLAALGANAVLAASSRVYAALFALQLVFYLLALCGSTPVRLFRAPIFKIPSYFVVVNLSILHAWLWVLMGRRILEWSPSTRRPTDLHRESA